MHLKCSIPLHIVEKVSRGKTEIVPSSSVITMDVWVSQNIKIVIQKPEDVFKSDNVLGFVFILIFPVLLCRHQVLLLWEVRSFCNFCLFAHARFYIVYPKTSRVAPLPRSGVHVPSFFHLLVFWGFCACLWYI